jgi:alpha-amylase/alpha-mannosidase (GH57 family)
LELEKMERYVCIHGHFYQPPRENPWLEVIELQDSAYPYHDWNRKVTAECYAPNASSRILDEKERIISIGNNYAKISFDVGPTLIAWMKKNTEDIYQAILDADRESRDRFSGHGSALAQAYNHMILPLANYRDKVTQILWGIKDFESHFGRSPEGMWLPETAVDLESLDIMAGFGIRFTILAPHQAKQFKVLDEPTWHNLERGNLDTTRPYIQHLPSGRTIVLFFYDGPTARAVAFEKLLANGGAFANRLIQNFHGDSHVPQLVHIATDGESYGHHHRFGDMALAYALDFIEKNRLARLTNYGEFLENHPPAHEVMIHENTSWSCMHGIERWRSDCGCHTGAHPEWRQAWRKPLREGVERLRDTLAPLYEEKGVHFLKDPWEARNDYIQCILNRSDDHVRAFLEKHRCRELNEEERVTTIKLLEIQRQAMLMFTSCGWFFDDISGIEAVQIIMYAGRAIQLGEEIFGRDLAGPFLEHLEGAPSNLPAMGNGRRIYETNIADSRYDLKKVCAHYAAASLFEDFPEKTMMCAYEFERKDLRISEAGNAKLILGRIGLRSQITQESAILYFGLLHLGDHNLTCGVAEDREDSAYQTMVKEVTEAFDSADFPETLRRLDKHFPNSSYSLKSLYRDEQRRILNLVLESTLKDAESVYRNLYEQYAPLMQFLTGSNTPPPKSLSTAAEIVLNADLRQALEEEKIPSRRVKNLLKKTKLLGVSLDTDTLEYTFRNNLRRQAEKFYSEPKDPGLLNNLADSVELLRVMPFRTDLWKVQNICYSVLQSHYASLLSMADQGDTSAQDWIITFNRVAGSLSVRISPDQK